MPGKRFDPTAPFADQFEPDGDGFTYRRRDRDAPIRVTAEERERFIGSFHKRYYYLVTGILVTVVVFAAVSVIYEKELGTTFRSYQFDFSVVLMILSLVVIRWLNDAPARELRHRQPVGLPRSKEEVRRRMLARVTWWGLAVGGALGSLFFAACLSMDQLWSDLNWLWLVGTTAYLILIVVRAYQKWRYR